MGIELRFDGQRNFFGGFLLPLIDVGEQKSRGIRIETTAARPPRCKNALAQSTPEIFPHQRPSAGAAGLLELGEASSFSLGKKRQHLQCRRFGFPFGEMRLPSPGGRKVNTANWISPSCFQIIVVRPARDARPPARRRIVHRLAGNLSLGIAAGNTCRKIFGRPGPHRSRYIKHVPARCYALPPAPFSC